MQLVQQRVNGAVDTTVIVVPTLRNSSGPGHPADISGVQALDVKPVRGLKD